MAVNLDQLPIGVAVGETHRELLGQGFAERGLACTRRTVQQHYTVPGDNERVYPSVREQQGRLCIVQQLERERERGRVGRRNTCQHYSTLTVSFTASNTLHDAKIMNDLSGEVLWIRPPEDTGM